VRCHRSLNRRYFCPPTIHTYLPVSSGNTIPPDPPCASYIAFIFSKPTGPLGGSKHTPGIIYLLLLSESPCLHHRDGALQHQFLFFFYCFPLAMLAIVRLICACIRLRKPTRVWCAGHIWHVPSTLISPLWTACPWSPLEFPGVP